MLYHLFGFFGSLMKRNYIKNDELKILFDYIRLVKFHKLFFNTLLNRHQNFLFRF